MLTSQVVYQLIADLEQYNQYRYTTLSEDRSAYYTIIRTFVSVVQEKEVHYVVVVCPVFNEYTPDEISNVSFYQVYVNPFTTQMTFTPLSDAIPLSYSINNSSVFVAYQNQNMQLNFTAPYVTSNQIHPLKETILSFFSFPTQMVLLYQTMFLQLNYIPTDPSLPQAYQVTLKGLYKDDGISSSVSLVTYFDFNKTMVLLDMFANPCLFLNNQNMQIGNTQDYLYNPNPSEPLEMVVGFNYNYVSSSNTEKNGVVARVSREDGSRTLNIQGNSETPKARSISYTALSSVIPLAKQENTVYFLGGVNAINYAHQPLANQAGWAAIQLSNILNSNSVVTTKSFALIYAPTTMGLTQYKTTSLWYSLDILNQTLTVWEDPTMPSFSTYVTENTSTISFQDVIQFSHQDLQQLVVNDNTRMGGCKWWDLPCKVREIAEAIAAAARAVAANIRRFFKEKAAGLAAKAKEFLDKIPIVGGAVDAMLGTISMVKDGILAIKSGDFANWARNAAIDFIIGQIVDRLAGAYEGGFDLFYDRIQSVIGLFSNLFPSAVALDKISDLFNNTFGRLKTIEGNVHDFLTNMLRSMVDRMIGHFQAITD